MEAIGSHQAIATRVECCWFLHKQQSTELPGPRTGQESSISITLCSTEHGGTWVRGGGFSMFVPPNKDTVAASALEGLDESHGSPHPIETASPKPWSLVRVLELWQSVATI